MRSSWVAHVVLLLTVLKFVFALLGPALCTFLSLPSNFPPSTIIPDNAVRQYLLSFLAIAIIVIVVFDFFLMLFSNFTVTIAIFKLDSNFQSLSVGVLRLFTQCYFNCTLTFPTDAAAWRSGKLGLWLARTGTCRTQEGDRVRWLQGVRPADHVSSCFSSEGLRCPSIRKVSKTKMTQEIPVSF